MIQTICMCWCFCSVETCFFSCMNPNILGSRMNIIFILVTRGHYFTLTVIYTVYWLERFVFFFTVRFNRSRHVGTHLGFYILVFVVFFVHDLVFLKLSRSILDIKQICRVYLQLPPITKAFHQSVWGVSIHHYCNTTTEHLLASNIRFLKSEIFTDECGALPSTAVWGPLLWRCQRLSAAKMSLSPGEIRQQSSSPVRLRHGIDAKISRGGLMMFQSYSNTLLLFFWLPAFARGPGLSTPAVI